MHTTKTTNLDAKPSPLSFLGRLGWSPFFQAQLDPPPAEGVVARIVGVRKNSYLARCEGGDILTTLAGRVARNSALIPPVVGDWVLIRETQVTAILTRRNTLLRQAPGGRARQEGAAPAADQVMAANLDLVLIVCGLDRDYNLRRIERSLTLVYNCGIDPAIVLTKADLQPDPEAFRLEVEAIACGVPVRAVSARDDQARATLADLLGPGRTAALIGSSGAGKSTLINRLYGEDLQPTGAVGQRLGKGRHTTTSRELIVLPGGGMVIDNPGIREIGLAVEAEGAAAAFPEIEELAQFCRFADCSHTHEPGCRVVEAVARGELAADRLASHAKLAGELAYQRQRLEKSASRLEKERWKGIAQKARAMRRQREGGKERK